MSAYVWQQELIFSSLQQSAMRSPTRIPLWPRIPSHMCTASVDVHQTLFFMKLENKNILQILVKPNVLHSVRVARGFFGTSQHRIQANYYIKVVQSLWLKCSNFQQSSKEGGLMSCHDLKYNNIRDYVHPSSLGSPSMLGCSPGDTMWWH